MPRPSALNQGHAFFVVVYAIRARIARTSRPLASAIHRKMWSATTPGGRSPEPNPRGAGGGVSSSRGGATTAMRESGLYRDARDERGHGGGGGPRPVQRSLEVKTPGRRSS